MLLTRRLVLFGGKGGVGKTTMAAAHALALAGRGHRTLLASTDPAHSTGDVLGLPLGDEPRQVADHLDAMEIDAEAHADRHVARIKADARTVVSAEAFPAVERHLELARTSPGTMESALLDRVVELFGDCPDPYDRIVFDTAPTGHTLRLLALPQLVGGLVEGLVRQRERVTGMDRMLRNLAGDDAPADDPLLARLRRRRDRLRDAGDRLREDATFWLVLVPERLPIEETARAADTLTSAGLDLAGLIVNRVLPGGGPDPTASSVPENTASGTTTRAEAEAYLRARRRQQDVYLAEIDRRFADLPRLRVAQAPNDVVGTQALSEIAASLDGMNPGQPPM